MPTKRSGTQQKRNRKSGKQGENAAIAILRSIGMRCIEPIETGITIVKTISRNVSMVTATFFYNKKVSGDFHAITKDGRPALIEVKTVQGKLSVSAFKPHQLRRHREYEEAGGVVVIVWVCPGHGVYVLDPADIQTGKPLDPETASELHLMRYPEERWCVRITW